jgi:hypothetical protein
MLSPLTHFSTPEIASFNTIENKEEFNCFSFVARDNQRIDSAQPDLCSALMSIRLEDAGGPRTNSQPLILMVCCSEPDIALHLEVITMPTLDATDFVSSWKPRHAQAVIPEVLGNNSLFFA